MSLYANKRMYLENDTIFGIILMVQNRRGDMEKLKLNLDEIENKVFPVDFKGYSSYEVDSFLDDVMSDYETYDNEMNRLNGLVKHYENIISELSQENQHLKAKIASNEAALGTTQPSTLDIIRRVARLEEIVLNKDNNQQ